jgi:hypothetical protein
MIYVTKPLDLPAGACPHHGQQGTLWGHLLTDGPLKEFHDFATKIMGLPAEDYKDEPLPHYPVTQAQVTVALGHGAQAMSRKELCNLLMGKKPKKNKNRKG